MKIRYIGLYVDDGVELHNGTWFDGNVDTDVAELGEETVRGLLAQPANWAPADEETRALVSAVESSVEVAPLPATPVEPVVEDIPVEAPAEAPAPEPEAV